MIRDMIMAAAGSGKVPLYDPFYDKVVLLVDFDGADGATTFNVRKGPALTAVGNAQLDTAQYKFGTASLLLDGTGDCASAADSADWQLGADYTVEAFVRVPSAQTGNIAGQWSESNAAASSFALYLSSSVVYFGTANGGTTYAASAGTLTNDVWAHVVGILAAGKQWAGKDGTMGSAVAGPAGSTNASVPLGIGNLYNNAATDWGTTYDLSGWIDSLRITKGVARYVGNSTATATYSAPTAAFPGGGGIQFIGSAGIQGDGTITYPSGTQNGDLVVLFATNAASTVFSTPSGYTNHKALPWAGYNYGSAVCSRVVNGDTSVSVSVQVGAAHLVVFRGASGVGAVGSAFAQSAGTSVTASAITTTGVGSLVLSLAGEREASSYPYPPVASGWEHVATHRGTYFTHAFGCKVYPTSGTSTGSLTWNGFGSTYDQIAINVELLQK